MIKLKTYHRFVQANLIYTLAVIVWGAFVRASGSGAGCGKHWPLCNGEVIPQIDRIQTVIEFMHRATSGLSLVFVLALFFGARFVSEKGSLLRRVASLSLVAIILEALLGAGLVLLKLVEFDQSLARVISISLHLVNTLFLLTALAVLTWVSAKEARAFSSKKFLEVLPGDRTFKLGFLFFLCVGVTGAITALGDTLFPASSIAQGMAQDLSPTAHFLTKLRVFHPLFATGWVLFAFLWSQRLKNSYRMALIMGITMQFLIGIMNWALMAPTWLQLVHLLMADSVFLIYIFSGLNSHET